MIEANSVVKEQFTQALCLIVPLNDPTLAADITQLSLLAGIDEASLPSIVLMHSRTEQTVRYPGPLDTLTAEILLVWARFSAIEIERVGFKQYIEELRDEVDTEPRVLEHWETIYNGGERDLVFLK